MLPIGLLILKVVAVLMSSYHCNVLAFKGLNIALEMPASQGPDTFDNHYASLAVNGNTDNKVNDGSCAHTGSGTGAWWSVDLESSLIIRGIRIYNRDKPMGRLENFRIVGTPGNVDIYNDELAPRGQKRYMEVVIEIIVNTTQSFSKIMVTVPGNYLTLCEVQIYSEFCKLPDISGTALTYTLNGSHARDEYIYVGTVVTFSCEPKDLFELIGDNRISCQADGSYSGNTPKCVKVCSHPPRVVNGFYTDVKDIYIPGDSVWFKCLVGFLPQTYTKLTCVDDSTWSEQTPSCTNVTCSHPGQIEHGYYVFSNGSRFSFGNVKVDTTILVSCEMGFVPLFNTRQCSAIAAWTGEGKCIQISSINCSLDSLRPNENFYALDNNYGDFVGYNISISATCRTGYEKRSGDLVRRCLSNQCLSGSELVCSAVNCSLESLQPAEHLYMFDEEYGETIEYNDTVSTSCQDECVRTSGDPIRRCLSDQSLSGTELICATKSGPPEEQHGISKAVFGVTVVSAVIITIIISVIVIIRLRRHYKEKNRTDRVVFVK